MVTLNALKGTSLAAYRSARHHAHKFTNFAKTEGQKHQVNLGWYHKIKCSKEERKQTGKKYKLVEATMPEEVLKNIPKIARNTLLSTMILGVLGFTKGKFEEIRYFEKLPQMIAQNIEKAKTLASKKDSLIFDEVLPYPAKFAYITKDTLSSGYRFFNALRTNKESLMRDLAIDKETYNTCARVALKIAHNESQLGASPKFKFYDKLESYDFIRDIGSGIRKVLRGDGALSLGMTQFKIANASETEKALFKKYGINFEKSILEPEKSAIATIIHLAEVSKDYPKYLERIRKLHPNTKDFKVKQSIKNAKQILFNDDIRPDALKALVGELYTKETQLAGITTGAEFANVTAKDLEDLKIYASTVELSPEAYLAARWPGKTILPEGERKNIACRNLLNIIAQKGYIANVDKSSKIIY